MVDADKVLGNLNVRRTAALQEIATVAKSLVPALRDLSQHHQADRVEAALGTLEQVEAEADAFIKDNFFAVIDMIRRGTR